MDEDYGSIARAQQNRAGRTRTLLGAGIVAIAVSLVGLVWWGCWHPGALFSVKREQQPAAAVAAPVPTPSAAASEATAAQARQAVAQVRQVVQQQGGLDSRVAAMEQRLSKLDLQLQAASGNASRT